MPVGYKVWELSNAERQKFDDWMNRILTGHTGTKDVRNERINWSPLSKPLSQYTVGVFSPPEALPYPAWIGRCRRR